ncbi:MAG: hypothetical protein RIC80_11565 [Cyclobacteriaceae bacterium]
MKRIITILVAALAACSPAPEADMLTKIDQEVRANSKVYETLAKSM